MGKKSGWKPNLRRTRRIPKRHLGVTPVFWLWLGLAVLASAPVLLALALVLLYFHLCRKYLHFVIRIFHEKPLFIIPRGQLIEDAEEVRFTTEDGLLLVGCYLKTPEPRKGVILFGLEFGS